MEPEIRALVLVVLWRGKTFNLDINNDSTLMKLGTELQKLSGVKSETMRLMIPRSNSSSSKFFSPFSHEHSHLKLLELSFQEVKYIRMVGVPEDEVNELQKNVKDNLRIAGFDEEERRLRQRFSYQLKKFKPPQGTYTFFEFRTLQIPGVELTPPSSEALRRMHALAADPGIVAIMNKHHWSIRLMSEMAPVGLVGITPKCLLGFNKNCGEEISLRLRTDDLKGFRKHESVKKTLLHELAHMVHSEHDSDFFAFEKQLTEEASQLDWTKSAGRRVVDSDSHHHRAEEETFSEPERSYHKLGGRVTRPWAGARAASVAAAFDRRAAKINVGEEQRGKGSGDKAEEPELDDPKAEPDPDEGSIGGVGLDSATDVYSRLQTALRKLKLGPNQAELGQVVGTLLKIIRNVMDNPGEVKFKRIRMGNPVFQKHVANHEGAMEVLRELGFTPEEGGGWLVLKRNDPALLWLGKSALETWITLTG